MLSSAVGLVEINPGEAERDSGIGLKLFGFIPGIGVHLHPGSLFGIIPEWRSDSSRNRVHFPRNPQYEHN